MNSPRRTQRVGGKVSSGKNENEMNASALTPLIPNYLYKRLERINGQACQDRRSGGQRFHGVVKVVTDTQGEKYEKKSVIDGVVGKKDGLDGACGVDSNTWRVVTDRQIKVLMRCYGDDLLALPTVLTSPLVCGTGIESLTEVGFSFQNPYGLPYYPGSSIKGLARTWARELGVDKRIIEAFFGSKVDQDQQGSKGALWFLDAFPEPKYKREILTPHLKEYLQDEDSETSDVFSPSPVSFVTISPGARMWIWVIRRGNLDDSWREQIQKILEYSFDFGIGAKTSSGYGLGRIDRGLYEKAISQVQEYQKESVRALEERRKEETLASLTSEERRLREMLERRDDISMKSSKYMSILKEVEKGPTDQAMPSFLIYVANLTKEAFEEEDKWLTKEELASDLTKKKRRLKEDVEFILKCISSDTVS